MFGTTLSPLISWRILFQSTFTRKLAEKELADPWLINKSDIPFWLSRSAFAILAIARWYERYTDKQSPEIWIPDFFCNQALEFIRDKGYRVKFYQITDQLVPDWDACRADAIIAKPDIFVLVHYFGYPSATDKARIFCDENHSILVEDASHVLIPQQNIGLHGDFIFYSPHKLIAIPDGALLIQNSVTRMVCKKGKKDPIKLMRNVLELLPQASPEPWSWLFKRLLQRVLPDILWLKKEETDDFIKINPLPMRGQSVQSNMSRCLLTSQVAYFDSFCKERHRNYINLKHAIESHNIKLLFESDDHVSYMIGFRVEKEAHARKLYNLLKKHRVPVMKWPDFAPEVLESPRKHSVALGLKKSLLFLPVHQTTPPSMIAKLAHIRPKTISIVKNI